MVAAVCAAAGVINVVTRTANMMRRFSIGKIAPSKHSIVSSPASARDPDPLRAPPGRLVLAHGASARFWLPADRARLARGVLPRRRPAHVVPDARRLARPSRGPLDFARGRL